MLLLFLMSLGAAFVQRVSGFGFGIFIMTVLPYIMPSYGEATTLSGLMAMVTSLIIAIRNYRYLHWKKLFIILFTFLIVSYIAVQFVSIASDGILKKLLGGILIFASIWFLFLSKRVHLPATVPVQISMGTISGLMGGFFGMQGPPAVLYFISSAKQKEEYMAMAQMYFLLGNIFMTGYRAQCGYLTAAVLHGWCCGIVAVLIGTTLGSIVFRFVSLDILRKIIYAYMAISGIIALLQICHCGHVRLI